MERGTYGDVKLFAHIKLEVRVSLRIDLKESGRS